jgi:hypothetical protein
MSIGVVAHRQGLAGRVTSMVLTALLLAGFPGANLAWATEPGAAAATGGLDLTTDPPGAIVYVDGKVQGSTPFAASALPAGDHRVKVVKKGYLENSRVVRLSAGRTEKVQLKLTRSSASTAAAIQVEEEKDKDTGGGGGGGKKIALIGLGVVAVGAGAYFLLRETNKAPVASGVTATPSTGLAGATSVSFTANATDPDGDPLTFNWNFGDGGTGTGQTTTHTFQTGGAFNVQVTVSDGELSATANTSVTVRTLTGTFRGTLDNFFQATVSLSQNGTVLSGSYADQLGDTTRGPVTGSVAGPNRVTITVDPACCIPFTFQGTVDDAVNRISGTTNGSGFVNAPWTLVRQ